MEILRASRLKEERNVGPNGKVKRTFKRGNHVRGSVQGKLKCRDRVQLESGANGEVQTERLSMKTARCSGKVKRQAAGKKFGSLNNASAGGGSQKTERSTGTRSRPVAIPQRPDTLGCPPPIQPDLLRSPMA